MNHYKKKRKCPRCGAKLADDEPSDRGTEWDYNDLCLKCAEELDEETSNPRSARAQRGDIKP